MPWLVSLRDKHLPRCKVNLFKTTQYHFTYLSFLRFILHKCQLIKIGLFASGSLHLLAASLIINQKPACRQASLNQTTN